jgi:hypothetical protein
MDSVLERMRKVNYDQLIILPLFPQYASASSGSAIEKAMSIISKWWVIPEVKIISQFWDKDGYIDSIVDRAKSFDWKEYDHVLFSYHGLPERQVDKVYDGSDLCSDQPCETEMNDENKFLALDDTSSFQLFLRKPSQSSASHLFFSNTPELTFIPGSLPLNKARLEWKPNFPQDGKYDLIVKAKDRTNNASGSIQYSISFEVINKSTITNILNYPNPFSTKTHFVFTLTGSEIPDNFRIQIMTITGKVVKDIRRDELGPIRIGRNITEYTWDGRDEFGDQLANGIYLYRVMTSIDGQQIERRETGADTYFERGFGKMYLMH